MTSLISFCGNRREFLRKGQTPRESTESAFDFHRVQLKVTEPDLAKSCYQIMITLVKNLTLYQIIFDKI